MAAETLVSSMLTISRDPVPAMRAKLTARFEPSTATKESDPSAWSESIAFAAMADSNGIRICIDGGDRISRHHDRVVGKLGEQKVAEDNLATLARFHEIGPVTEIDTDK